MSQIQNEEFCQELIDQVDDILTQMGEWNDPTNPFDVCIEFAAQLKNELQTVLQEIE